MSLMMRRRMMQSQADKKAKYPFVNGRHDFTDGSYVEVTNGNHIYIYTNSVINSYINVSDINKNSTNVASPVNVNNLPELYSFNTGDVCELLLKNIKFSSVYGEYSGNFRKANQSASGNFGFRSTRDSNDKNIQITMETDESYGCYFFYITNKTVLECDIEFYVNRERYI